MVWLGGWNNQIDIEESISSIYKVTNLPCYTLEEGSSGTKLNKAANLMIVGTVEKIPPGLQKLINRKR